jgi:hypothetical protein
MKPVPDDTTQVVRRGVEKACRDFSERVASLGFARTMKMFWTKRNAHTVDFVHLHRSGSTYGKPINYSVHFQVHFGIRVLNHKFEAAALNGPFRDPPRLRVGLYHLRFNAQTGSNYDRCVEDLARFVAEQGEPWFVRFRNPDALVSFQGSPLRQDEKERLIAAMTGNSDASAVAHSLKLLGIKTHEQ